MTIVSDGTCIPQSRTRSDLAETGFGKSTRKNCGKSRLDPDMGAPCFCRNNKPMRHLELRLPRGQLDLGSPQGPDEHQPFFGSREAPALSEAEQSSLGNDRAGLLQHLSMECLLPRFVLLWPATWQTPAFTIMTDQNKAAISGQTDARGSVRCSFRSHGCWLPGHDPVAVIGTKRELFTVTCREISFHQSRNVYFLCQTTP